MASQAANSCVIVDGMAQWLCALDGRWQRKALSAVARCHTGGVLAANVITDHTTFLNYVIQLETINWP